MTESVTVTVTETPEPTPTPTPQPTPPTPITLYLNIGDSLAAGYNANPRNTQSYWALILAALRRVHPDTQFIDLAESGDQSSEIENRVLRARLPSSTPGAVLVTLTGGGNDVNDDIRVLLSQRSTQNKLNDLQESWRTLFAHIRRKYPNNDIHFLVMDVHDPTDGLGTIPAHFEDGFCSALKNPLFAVVKDVGLANLALFNAGIHEVVEAEGGVVIPLHDALLGHGMNARVDRYVDDDCAHLNNAGHAFVRDLLLGALQGVRR